MGGVLILLFIVVLRIDGARDEIPVLDSTLTFFERVDAVVVEHLPWLRNPAGVLVDQPAP